MLERAAKQGQMENKVEDISGNSASNGESMGKFGRLTVLSVVREKGKKAVAICECDCGAEKNTLLSHVKSGAVKSCGCLKRETSAKTGYANKKHGQSSPESRGPEYRSWETMKARCYNKSNPDYQRYGGRGISVCDEWRSNFQNFFSDMGQRPKNTTLDRVDVNGNYQKENCRWATPPVQQRNKSTNRVVEFCGVKMTLVELAEKTGVPYQRLHERIVRRGWLVDDAVSMPPRGH